MQRRHSLFYRTLWLLVVAAATLPGSGGVAIAQAPPGPIDGLTQETSQLTPAQRGQVKAYAGFYSHQLGNGDPTKVGEARRKLKGPLERLGVTIFFRDAYASELIPALTPIIQDPDKHLGAMNAMQIVAGLGTQQALDVVTRHCDVRNETRIPIRIWAARGIRTILEQADEREIRPRDRTNATRALGRAVRHETDWRVVRRQLDAIAASGNTATEEELQGALKSVVARMKAEPQATPMMGAVRPTNVDFRNRFVGRPAAGQLAWARQIVPIVLEVLDTVDAHWDSAQRDRFLRSEYSMTTDVCEQLLALIDRTVGQNRIGSTSLRRAFEQKDRESFRQMLERIRQAITQPPYS